MNQPEQEFSKWECQPEGSEANDMAEEASTSDEKIVDVLSKQQYEARTITSTADYEAMDGLQMLFQSAINRGHFLILSIMDNYVELNLRHSRNERRISFLMLLREKVNNIFNPLRNTVWIDDSASNYRFDIDHVASEVYELLQRNGHKDLLECIMRFMALCMGGEDTFIMPSYLSFIDLVDTLRISCQHTTVLQLEENKMQESSGNVESALCHLDSASKTSSLRIIDRNIASKNSLRKTWKRLGFYISPKGVTYTRNPDIYRVQISLSRGRRVSHNVPGLENALFLYDILLHLSESFDRNSLVEKGNYSCLKSMSMVEDVQNYFHKLLGKVHKQFSSDMHILSFEDVRRIDLHHPNTEL